MKTYTLPSGTAAMYSMHMLAIMLNIEPRSTDSLDKSEVAVLVH